MNINHIGHSSFMYNDGEKLHYIYKINDETGAIKINWDEVTKCSTAEDLQTRYICLALLAAKRQGSNDGFDEGFCSLTGA